MIYLSKVTFNLSAQKRAFFLRYNTSKEYVTHQLLWELFRDSSERSFIYREERTEGGMPEFFVLSQTEPDKNNKDFCIQVKPFAPKLDIHQQLGFQLRVNPTLCITDNQGKSKRHDVLMHAKRQLKMEACSTEQRRDSMHQAARAWIMDEKRLNSWGITIEGLPDVVCYTQHHIKKSTGQLMQFSSVDFQGVLTVQDSAKFMQQYVKGFGRAKAFGCGLMLIRPLAWHLFL